MLKKLGIYISLAAVAFIALALVGPYLPSPNIQQPVSAQVAYPLQPYGNLGFNNTTIAATGTAAAFQMIGLVTATTGAATTITTDTATNLCALFPFVQTLTPGAANWQWDWYVKSTGANTATVAAGAGVTLVGTGTSATATVRHYKIVLTNCTSGSAAATIYSLETSAF